MLVGMFEFNFFIKFLPIDYIALVSAFRYFFYAIMRFNRKNQFLPFNGNQFD